MKLAFHPLSNKWLENTLKETDQKLKEYGNIGIIGPVAHVPCLEFRAILAELMQRRELAKKAAEASQ